MRILSIALVASAFLFGGPLASAQDYPSRPIRWLVPYPAGGGADNIARLVAHRTAEIMKQSIVVDNRAGGNTVIATQVLLSSPKDGYTVMHTVEQIASNTSLYPNLPYSAERDIDFIAQIARVPFILLVRPNLPVTDAASMIAYMKKEGEKINYGSYGQGGANHLIMEAFADRVGVRPTHIPFQGAAPAVQNLLGGQIDIYFSDPTVALPYIRSGRLKALLVTTKDRLPYLPDVPTVAESGYPGFDMYTWHGLVAPKGTPPDIVRSLSAVIKQVVSEPTVHKELLERGLIPDPQSPEQFRDTFLKSQASLGSIVRKLNIKIQ
ncbi:tripartite tricarboxylate transporter substrate binding protein [Variovorax sp. E3]|uniref:Bug family tripartite tricarboxylate transporter substrate binding protein n=1 Tax=Variovorax sp. E3 TaxID=1914993 RepID=UPI0018DBED0B|nr:tripartite tricarboxylate transporter substrate binding protein [Variovorax sp. E3]